MLKALTAYFMMIVENTYTVFSQIIIPNWEFIKNQKASSFLWDTSDPAVIFDFPKVFYIHSNPSVKGT